MRALNAAGWGLNGSHHAAKAFSSDKSCRWHWKFFRHSAILSNHVRRTNSATYSLGIRREGGRELAAEQETKVFSYGSKNCCSHRDTHDPKGRPVDYYG